MGMLQSSKSRKKISNDPNNTKWTRDNSTFGQKILRSQGWQPGQFLGVQGSSHAALHTAASASYIRVALKDDMKGLGFNSKTREGEVTGLDVFSDVLNRLNGKSEAAIAEDQRARLAVQVNHYVEMRWGPMRFIRGGLLVGDEMQEEEAEDEKGREAEGDGAGVTSLSCGSPAGESTSRARSLEVGPQKSDKGKKSKKRRRDEVGDGLETEKKKRRKDRDESSEKKKGEKKKNKPKSRGEPDDSSVEDDDNKNAKPDGSDVEAEVKNKKEKRAQEKEEKERKKSEKRARKEDKERRKLEKRAKKEAKKRRKAADANGDNYPDGSKTDRETTTATTAPTTATTRPRTAASTPAVGSGTSTPTALGSRNFVRSRYIAQKRLALLDAKALNQIFMVKAQ